MAGLFRMDCSVDGLSLAAFCGTDISADEEWIIKSVSCINLLCMLTNINIDACRVE